VLAYVFWHQAASGVDPARYEQSLDDFHRSLAADPPEGFRRSLWHRFEALPWLGGGPGYEDWYLVEGWTQVGALESGAVTGSRRGPHDGVAVAAGSGAGAVYGLVTGPEDALETGRRVWFDKPAGLGYAELDEMLGSTVPTAAAVWRRRLVLGPAPENCVAGASAAALPAGLDAAEAAGTRPGTE
jgi:hypothetical protein